MKIKKLLLMITLLIGISFIGSSSVYADGSINIGDTCKTIKDGKLHIIPVMYASVIQNLNSGASVKVIQIANNWVYVETDKYNGWITINCLDENAIIAKAEETEPVSVEPEESKQEESKPVETEPEKEQPKEQEETTTTNKVGYVNVGTAFVRKGPSVDYEDITTINQNTEVKILGEKNKWYHIKFKENGKEIEGYINKKLVSDEKVTSTSRSLTEARTSVEEKAEEQVIENKETEIQEQVKETVATTKGAEIVQYAKQFLGGKYVSGGNNPATGVDCSGFTKYVFAHFGYTLARTTSGQAENGKDVAKEKMQEGDIIVFLNDSKTSIGHVGIYIGNNQFIHAANAKRGIVIDSVDNSYYKPRFVCARRII